MQVTGMKIDVTSGQLGMRLGGIDQASEQLKECRPGAFQPDERRSIQQPLARTSRLDDGRPQSVSAAALIDGSGTGNNPLGTSVESKSLKNYRRRMAKILGDALDRGDSVLVRKGIAKMLKVVERAGH